MGNLKLELIEYSQQLYDGEHASDDDDNGDDGGDGGEGSESTPSYQHRKRHFQ